MQRTELSGHGTGIFALTISRVKTDGLNSEINDTILAVGIQ
jgi:hypothetical protein